MLKGLIKSMLNAQIPALTFGRSYIPAEISKSDFALKTCALLDMEKQAEFEKLKKTRKDNTNKPEVLNLSFTSEKIEYFGRIVARFESIRSRKKMSSMFKPGDFVQVNIKQDKNNNSTEHKQCLGLVSKIFPAAIEIVYNHRPTKFDTGASYDLLKIDDNDMNYRIMKEAMQSLLSTKKRRCQRMIDICFSRVEISKPKPELSVDFVNKNLDESQREAVTFALRQEEVAIIVGPPGTGKTTTLVELIEQANMLGQKVLVTAHTNTAVDNLAEKLGETGLNVLRLGHPVRMLPKLHDMSLEAIIEKTEEKKKERRLREHLKRIEKMSEVENKKEKKALKVEIKMLKKEIAQLDLMATKKAISSADAILITLISAASTKHFKQLKKDHFDFVVIDECSQALEAASWIPLMQAPKCVLAGDPLQLPPIITSIQAAKGGLEQSLMERLIKLFKDRGDNAVRTLTTQYRMHTDIMEWSSGMFYDSKLTAHPSVAGRLLRDLPGVSDSEPTRSPLLLVDTAGLGLSELSHNNNMSIGNQGEAELVALHIHYLVSQGLKPADIAVIAPYALQINLLRRLLASDYPDLEIRTVDGFQGREKEAVIISLVRSNPSHNVGFLAEERRMNVAVTRARRNLTLICDTATVGNNKFMRTLVQFIRAKGTILTPFFYQREESMKELIRINKKM